MAVSKGMKGEKLSWWLFQSYDIPKSWWGLKSSSKCSNQTKNFYILQKANALFLRNITWLQTKVALRDKAKTLKWKLFFNRILRLLYAHRQLCLQQVSSINFFFQHETRTSTSYNKQLPLSNHVHAFSKHTHKCTWQDYLAETRLQNRGSHISTITGCFYNRKLWQETLRNKTTNCIEETTCL